MSRLLPDRGRVLLLPRARRLFRALVAIALGATLPVFACAETETNEVPGDPCKDGVLVDGVCMPSCDPDKCVSGNVCVGHECKLVCTSHRDCDMATQECVPPVEGTEVTGDGFLVWLSGVFGVCTNKRQPVPGAMGWGAPCPEGFECNALACPNGLECDPFACTDGGGVAHPEWCQRDPAACNCQGEDADGNRACVGDEKCNIGTCQVPDAPEDGMNGLPCTVMTCDAPACTPFFCNSAGFGDGHAYCTHHDCTEDSDCPGGWYCGVTRDPHDICGPTCNAGSCSDNGASCGIDADCQKGNNGACGETLDPCIPPDQFNLDGKQLFEGSVCLLRRTCLKREPCAPCEDNLDCSLDRDAVCLDIAGSLVCSKFCQTHDDCYGDEACSPSYPTCEYSSTLPCGDVMPNSEACPVFPCIDGACVMPDGNPGGACASDQDCPRQACVERQICLNRFGACTGTGQFCEPCLDDTQCGGPESTVACSEVTDGQHACFDQSFPAQCPGGQDAECPTAPSGAPGECLDSAEGVDPGHPLYHRCYFPFSPMLGRFTCWPMPL